MADSGSSSGSDSDSDFEAGEGNESSGSSSPSEDEGEGEGEGDNEDEDEATGALGGEDGSTLKRTLHLNFGLSERCGLKRDGFYSTRETSGLLFTFSCVC
jgi:hypothetical protein